jgi:hypothetical protein
LVLRQQVIVATATADRDKHTAMNIFLVLRQC